MPVVYLTASKDFALEAFGVHAFGYLVKPWTRKRFDEALDLAFDRHGGGISYALGPNRLTVSGFRAYV